ncbi:DUF6242 domain-containing protein [Flavitalea flava]
MLLFSRLHSTMFFSGSRTGNSPVLRSASTFRSFRTFRSLSAALLIILAAGACKKSANLSDLAGFTTFSIKELNVPFTIDETAGTISNKDSLAFQYNVSSLTAVFTTVPNATVKAGVTLQVSGSTTNDFSSPVNYVVVAQNGSSTRNYKVTVNVAKVDPKTVSWQQLTLDAGWGNNHNLVAGAFNNKFYAYGATLGFSNSIKFGAWSSTDGVTWGKLPAVDDKGDSVSHGEFSALVPSFNNKIYLLGGHRPGVGFAFDFVTANTYSSSDGTAWTVSAPVNAADRFSARERIGAVVFNNNIFAVGGNAYPFGGNTASQGTAYNDVWSSPDGAAWTKVTAAAAFPARSNPAVFVYDNKIWVAGGKSGSTYLNDVWNSTDGANWTQVTTSTVFTGRFGHSVAVYNNEIFLAGGEDADGVKGDLWVSEDAGVNWAQVKAGDVRALPANFPARTYFSFFVQGTALYIVGGLGAKDVNNKYTYQNDVWKGVLAK